MTNDVYLTLIRHEDAPVIARALARALEALGFARYDPFPGGDSPAALWQETVRAFVAPARDGWTRVLGQTPPDALERAQAAFGAPALHLWLTRDVWGFLLFAEGADAVDVAALAGLLRPGRSLADVQQALGGEIDPAQLPPMGADDAPAALPRRRATPGRVAPRQHGPGAAHDRQLDGQALRQTGPPERRRGLADARRSAAGARRVAVAVGDALRATAARVRGVPGAPAGLA
ncbi:MAG: hypothetical protein M5R40_03365 [Anaerolineae bacterium]|nr:hypothetical protein [Anaerolineae bacterium]